MHPWRGSLPPNVFITPAEEIDLIYEFAAFAMREAVTVAVSWGATSASSARPYVTVNFRIDSFTNGGLASMIDGAPCTGGLPSERLVIENTKNVALLDVAQTLAAIGTSIVWAWELASMTLEPGFPVLVSRAVEPKIH